MFFQKSDFRILTQSINLPQIAIYLKAFASIINETHEYDFNKVIQLKYED